MCVASLIMLWSSLMVPTTAPFLESTLPHPTAPARQGALSNVVQAHSPHGPLEGTVPLPS